MFLSDWVEPIEAWAFKRAHQPVHAERDHSILQVGPVWPQPASAALGAQLNADSGRTSSKFTAH